MLKNIGSFLAYLLFNSLIASASNNQSEAVQADSDMQHAIAKQVYGPLVYGPLNNPVGANAASLGPTFLSRSQSVLFPAAWANRGDVIDHNLDFQFLLNKAKVSKFLPIRNNTNQKVSICIKGKQFPVTDDEESEDDELDVTFDLTIAAGKMINILRLASYDAITLNSGSRGFLNFYTTKARFEISVEKQPVLLFPRPLSKFEFIPSVERPIVGDTDEAEQLKIKQYQDHVGYLRFVCYQEKIDPDDLYKQRVRLYEKYKLENLLQTSLPYIPRIPLNLFSIWLTNLNNPKEPDQELIDLALESSKVNPHKNGWNHYFLVQNPAIFPNTVKAFESSDVKMISYADLLGPLELQNEFDEALSARKFGMASDMLRIEALMKMGGGYLDIDLKVLQSLKPYFYLYNSLFSIEPMSEFIGNAFMASSPNHPIMAEFIRLIKRNVALKRAGNKSFYSSASDDGFNTIVQTGPCVTTVGFYNAAGRDGNVDIVMPPEAFYPAMSLKRPEFRIPTIADSINLTSATLHLWLTTWAGARGAKNGSLG